ncbi:PIG-L family deacetylase [Candidatus Woesearchaeota archaeon]|nr:PIG-L family deacetylase [Candidatus Woesearchaeota archaeon]
MSPKKKAQKETILVFGAHSDDFVIGAGGTIAKYTQEGKKVVSVVFSYGEKSHPWLKGEVVQKMRSKEATEASKLLRCKNLFFGLKEGRFLKDYQKKKIGDKLINLIEKYKPYRIFLHSSEDPHPDHRALHKIILELWDKLPKPKPELYIYSVWNPVSFKTTYPVLYEDITHTFSLKVKALKKFKSQKLHTFYPYLLMFYRAIKNGLRIKKRFAEAFYRIK